MDWLVPFQVGFPPTLFQALAGRTVRHSVPIFGLSDQEVADYVIHKISCAGGSRSIIEPAALAAVHSHSQGNPRLIDNLMTDALALGAQMDKKTVSPDVILAAVGNQNLG